MNDQLTSRLVRLLTSLTQTLPLPRLWMFSVSRGQPDSGAQATSIPTEGKSVT